jgi:3-dehydroquinate synthase
MKGEIQINIGDISYQAMLGRNLDNQLVSAIKNVSKNKNILLVTDSFLLDTKAKKITDSLRENGFQCHTFEMTGGKGSKSFAELLSIYALLEANNFSRDSTLIALGGGVVGDLGGFAASTWYRGMNLIHIPTTLMAMVDSSIGGKVAINFRETINAVGGYYHPILNLMDLDLIDSLPQRDYIAGLAEVIKCGLIAEEEFLLWLDENSSKIAERSEKHLVHCIQKAIQIKIDHVDGDVQEGGKRLLLNFGHTLGHAIEMATHTEAGETFRHGEGVSLGIVAAMYIGDLYFEKNNKNTDDVIALLIKFGLPVAISASSLGFSRDALINLCFSLAFKDKKRKNNSLRFILLDKLGRASVYPNIPDEIVRNALGRLILE